MKMIANKPITIGNTTHETNVSCNKQIKLLKNLIKTRRSDMKLLIAFAIGEKKLPSRYTRNPKYWERTEEDDKRLFWTLRQIREQIHELEQQLASVLSQGDHV